MLQFELTSSDNNLLVLYLIYLHLIVKQQSSKENEPNNADGTLGE